MKLKPISPDEIKKELPSVVVEIVNNLLKKKWDGHKANIKQDEVVEALEAEGITRRKIFDDHMLDFEPLFRDVGWSVEFDKPAYCETYDANWTFKRRKA